MQVNYANIDWQESCKEKCKKEIGLYKKMYKIGKTQKIQPYLLYNLLDQAFDTASFGYQLSLYRDADFKIDTENFAKVHAVSSYKNHS